jgi:hypothetical protein
MLTLNRPIDPARTSLRLSIAGLIVVNPSRFADLEPRFCRQTDMCASRAARLYMQSLTCKQQVIVEPDRILTRSQTVDATPTPAPQNDEVDGVIRSAKGVIDFLSLSPYEVVHTYKRLQWTKQHQRAMTQYCRRWTLSKNMKLREISQLLQDFRMVGHGVVLDAALASRTLNAVRYHLEKRLTPPVVHERVGGKTVAFYPRWTIRWLDADWDGEVTMQSPRAHDGRGIGRMSSVVLAGMDRSDTRAVEPPVLAPRRGRALGPPRAHNQMREIESEEEEEEEAAADDEEEENDINNGETGEVEDTTEVQNIGSLLRTSHSGRRTSIQRTRSQTPGAQTQAESSRTQNSHTGTRTTPTRAQNARHDSVIETPQAGTSRTRASTPRSNIQGASSARNSAPGSPRTQNNRLMDQFVQQPLQTPGPSHPQTRSRSRSVSFNLSGTSPSSRNLGRSRPRRQQLPSLPEQTDTEEASEAVKDEDSQGDDGDDTRSDNEANALARMNLADIVLAQRESLAQARQDRVQSESLEGSQPGR